MTPLDKYGEMIDRGIYGEDVAKSATQGKKDIARNINSYNNKPNQRTLMSLSRSDYKQLKSTNRTETLLYGTLLNGVTSTADCCRTTADAAARAPLEKIQAYFRQLYNHPKNNTQTNINGLFDNLNHWLILDHNDPVNQEQAVSFCRSMHTILGIIRIQLEKSTTVWGAQTTIKMLTGLEVNESLAKIDTLLTAINNKHTLLTNNLMAIAASDQEQVIQPNKKSVQKGLPLSSLQDILNGQFLALIKTHEETQLTTLETKLTETCTNLACLIELRTKKAELNQGIQSTSSNLKQKKDKLQALSNNEPTESQHSPKQLKQPKNTPETMIATIQTMGITLITMGITLIKILIKPTHSSLPNVESVTSLREEENSIPNMEYLKQEISMTENDINRLQKNAENLEAEITQTEEKITQYTHIIANTSISTLQDILKTTQEIREAVINYNKLSKQVDDLDEISSTVDKIIEKNNTWHVKLSNFMAQISSFFLTKTAKTINDAYSLKNEIHQAVLECKQELGYSKQKAPLLETIPKSVKSTSSNANNSLDHFKEMKEKFQKIKNNKSATKNLESIHLTSSP